MDYCVTETRVLDQILKNFRSVVILLKFFCSPVWKVDEVDAGMNHNFWLWKWNDWPTRMRFLILDQRAVWIRPSKSHHQMRGFLSKKICSSCGNDANKVNEVRDAIFIIKLSTSDDSPMSAHYISVPRNECEAILVHRQMENDMRNE